MLEQKLHLGTAIERTHLGTVVECPIDVCFRPSLAAASSLTSTS